MEPPSRARISVVNSSGKRVPASLLRHAAEYVLQRYALQGQVSILLCGDREIQRLNQEFRGVDEPTDVLTFPAPAFPAGMLGDVAISVEYAERQANLRGVALKTELAYLAIHAALHLAGLDDDAPEDREAMLAAMAELGSELGLPPEPAWASILHEEAQAGDAA